MYERTIIFHDKEDKLVISELKITERNGYPEFTMCNERHGHSGQAEFKPKDGNQEILHTIWKKYHLNGKEPGLPDGFKDVLSKVCDAIELEESERFDNKISWDQIFNEDGEIISDLETLELQNLYDHKIIALAKHLDISPMEANEDIQQSNYNDCLYSYSGIEYLVCTDDEADELEREYLENMIDECYLYSLKNENKNHPALDYIDIERWINDWSGNRGENLGRYDGKENEEDVSGLTYYIYKQ